MRTRQLILICSIFLLLTEVHAQTRIDCTQAAFCAGTAVLACGVADGYCPEDYGNWEQPAPDTACEMNPFGGRCQPCDPDCPTCGQQTLLIRRLTPAEQRFKTGFQPGEQLEVDAGITKAATGGTLMMMREDFSLMGSFDCATDTCTNTWPREVPDIGGSVFEFNYYFTNYDVDSDMMNWPKTSSPKLTIDPGTPPDGSIVQGTVPLHLTAQSLLNIQRVNAYLEKEFPSGSGNYERVNPNDCRICPTEGCNLIDQNTVTAEITTQTLEWKSYLCDNRQFRILLTAEDSRLNAAEEPGYQYLTLTTNNEGAPTFQEPSRLLRLILARIKTWLL